MCPKTEPRTFASLFVGAAEIEKAVTLVGWIAIGHAGVEDDLNYLLWQLEAFARAARRSHQALSQDDLQRKLRELRQEMSWRPIKTRVQQVANHLIKGPVSKRLRDALPDSERFSLEWKKLGGLIISLSKKRDIIIHSSISWSGKLVRTTGGNLDGKSLPIDPERDNKTRSELRILGIALGEFATELGNLLPFASDDKIITIGKARTTI